MKLAIETMGGYNATSFAKTIIDCAKRRDLIEISHRLENDAYNMNCDDDFADLAEVAINGLSQSGDEKAVFNIGDAAIELMRRVAILKHGLTSGQKNYRTSLNL